MKYLSFSAERIFFFFFQLLTKYLYTIHTLYTATAKFYLQNAMDIIRI